MNPPKIINNKRGPEAIIQQALIEFLTLRGWYCKSTHGNIYQFGFPDIYATHKQYGQRWIECKCPKGYCFTPAQLEAFPKFCHHGAGVWVLTAATEEEYKKLWKPCNWWGYAMAQMPTFHR